MQDEKWSDLVDNIQTNFKIIEKTTKDDTFEDDLGNQFKGTKDIVIFEGPIGKTKIERTNRPVILDKKIHYKKTAGTGAKVEYIISDTEFTHRVKAYKWNNELKDWEEIKEGSSFSF